MSQHTDKPLNLSVDPSEAHGSALTPQDAANRLADYQGGAAGLSNYGFPQEIVEPKPKPWWKRWMESRR